MFVCLFVCFVLFVYEVFLDGGIGSTDLEEEEEEEEEVEEDE